MGGHTVHYIKSNLALAALFKIKIYTCFYEISFNCKIKLKQPSLSYTITTLGCAVQICGCLYYRKCNTIAQTEATHWKFK